MDACETQSDAPTYSLYVSQKLLVRNGRTTFYLD